MRTTVPTDAGPSLAERPGLVRALAEVKAAAARANERAGHLDPPTARAIVAAVDRVIADPSLVGQAPIMQGGGSIAVNRAMNDTLVRIAEGTVTSGDANRSQSTADVVHTAGRLALLVDAPRLERALASLALTLEASGRAWQAAAPLTLSRTCMQDAITVPTSLWPLGSAAAIDRARATVARAIEPMHAVVLGGTVVGTGAGASERYRRQVIPILSARTGLDLSPDPLAASRMQHSDDLVDTAGALAGVATRIVRLAQDLRLLTSGPTGGFGELVLAPTGCDSTFFAGKTNPVGCETAIQLGCRAIGHQASVAALAQQGELHLNVFDLAMALEVLDQITVLRAAADALAGTVATATVDAARCAALAGAAHPTKDAVR